MSTPQPFARESSPPATADAAWRLRAATALLVVFIACASLLVLRRGPWYDEIWTLWLSRNDLPLADIVQLRWQPDFHPPLFSFSHWLAQQAFGDALLPHRLLNLLPLAWAGVFAALAMQRYPRSAALLLVYAVLLLALPESVEYFAESRSYFAQICVFFVLAGATMVVLDSGRDLDWRHDKPLAAMLVVTVIVALNLHYINTLLVGLLLAGAIGLCAWQGKRLWAGTLLAAAALGGLPALLFLVTQLPYFASGSSNYWVSGSLGQAVMVLLRRVASASRSNPVALAVAAAAVVLGLGRIVRLRWVPAHERIFDAGFAAQLQLPPARRATVLMLVAVLATFSLLMLAAHARQPIVTGRYLITFQAGLLAVIACLAAEALTRRRVLFVLMIAAALLGVVQQTGKTLGEQRWDATARIVSSLIAECRSSPVHTALVPRMLRLSNSTAVLQWGYEWQAQRYGFQVQHLAASKPSLPIPTGACPALVWVEHVGRQPATVEGALQLLELDGSSADPAASVITGESGFVLKLPPPAKGRRAPAAAVAATS